MYFEMGKRVFKVFESVLKEVVVVYSYSLFPFDGVFQWCGSLFSGSFQTVALL